MSSNYRELRDRYFAGSAYDFRAHVLPGIATRMANAGAIDDAIALTLLNVEVYPDVPSAKQAWVVLMLERTIDAKGVEERPSMRPRILRRSLGVAVVLREPFNAAQRAA